MARLQNTRLNEIASLAGVNTLASVALLTPAEFMRRLEDKIPAHEAYQTLVEARKKRDELRILEKNILTRASPLLPAAIQVGLRHPDVSLQDYEEWFGGRDTRYARPGDISSMFSPAAYLTELYREARRLYEASSSWHIDSRRPDLSGLILSQENKDSEVMALTLSNEILMGRVRNAMKDGEANPSDDEVLQALAGHVQSSGTPYHHQHARLRQMRQLKDPDFALLSKAPAVIKHLSGAMFAGMAFDIPPALYDLLTDVIPEDETEVQEKFRDCFGEGVTPEVVISPTGLRHWYGLTDEETRWFIGGLNHFSGHTMTLVAGEYVKRVTIEQKNDHISLLEVYPVSDTVWRVRGAMSSDAEYGIYVDIWHISEKTLTWRQAGTAIPAGKVFERDLDIQDRYNETNNPAITTFPLFGQVNVRLAMHTRNDDSAAGGTNSSRQVTITSEKAHAFALKLNKAIRLYKATGLSPWILEDVVNSVNPNQITSDTLSLMFRAGVLVKRFGISHEDALVMSKSLISRNARDGEPSQFDRLFNTPPLVDDGFTADGRTISLLPENAVADADIKATLKRACQTDDDGLYHLKLIYHATDVSAGLPLSLTHISGMYALSLWARGLGLSPRELHHLAKMCGLPSALHSATAAQWQAFFEKIHATMQWMSLRNWTVTDLMLMTRDVAEIPAGTDITNLLNSLREAASAVELPDNPEFADYALPLAPSLSAALNLTGDSASRALLRWADQKQPGGITLRQFWDILIKSAPPGEETADAIAFSYDLAQAALIMHATGVPADALALFVSTPALLSDTASNGTVLVRSAEVVISLTRFSAWLRTLSDQNGAGAAVITSLATGGVTPSLLAQVTGLAVTTVEQAVTEALKHDDVGSVDKLISWQEINVVLEWMTLAQAFGVMPSDIGRILELDYRSGPSAATWADWKRVADAFSAALNPAQQRAAEMGVAGQLSRALSTYLLATKPLLPGNIRDRETLFAYLLSDNLNGPQVKTSRLAEAITSLQIFIHRALNLSPRDEEYQGIVREAFDRQFFRDWTQWNARYSTWAAGQKLMYYPENYIDPTMRLGQTQMMDDMLQVLGQAQINTDTVGDAFMGYLTGFEEVANLETVSGYHDSTDNDEGKTWFVGRNQMIPPEHWFRSVDEGKRGPEGIVPANAWTGWRKITVAAQPVGRLIRPVLYKERLYLGWVERVRHVTARNENGDESSWEYRWELKISWLRYDGGWSQPAVCAYSPGDVEELEDLLDNDTEIDALSLYLSSWPEKQVMVAGIYKQGAGSAGTVTSFAGEVFIYEDMTFRPTRAASVNWVILRQMLDEADTSKVLQPFVPASVQVENQLTSPSALPPGFTRFDATDLRVAVTDVNEDGSTYRLRMGLTMTVDMRRPEIDSWSLDKLFEYFPELRSVNSSCRVAYAINNNNTGGAILMRMEDGVWWGYLISNMEMNTWTRISSNYGDLPSEEVRVRQDGTKYYGIARYQLYAGDASLLFMAVVPNHDAGSVRGLMEILSEPNNQGGYDIDERFIVPSDYVNRPTTPGVIPVGQIASMVTGGGVSTHFPYLAHRAMDLSSGPDTLIWNPLNTYPISNPPFTFTGDEVLHTVTLHCGTGNTRTWRLRVYKRNEELTVDVIGTQETDGQHAQYLEHGDTRTRLNTLFARQLTERAVNGIDAILNYDTQMLPEPPLRAEETAGVMDFSGANAIYFWELFYYTPMMVMQRFLQEERYDLAEKWLKYVFSPSGYIVRGVPYARMWNVRPLEEDTGWNDEPLISYDPDAVAQNDPMHYKLNAFMRLLDITIGKGDAAYRKLERDTLAEAKVWYGRALCLLGEAPWIAPGAGWNNPPLGSVASDTVQNDRMEALSQMERGIRRSEDIPLTAVSGSTLFLPEVNEEMLRYWETLRIRLYNLRHNLTIDGQPMNLPLFATPADPKALLAAAVAAENGAGGEFPSVSSFPALRFTPLLESARSMASQLIQFGSSMQQILLSQDAEALAELLNTQGAAISASSISLQKQVLEELAAERVTLEKNLDTVTTRRNHYQALYQENVNARETHSMNLLTTSQTMSAAIKPLYVAGAVAGVAPNIFGLANGGMKYEGPLNAAGIGMEIAASCLNIAGSRIQQEEMYRRRREEWDIQYRMAEKEMQGIEAQLSALSVRETSAQMMLTHTETQTSQAQAQLALFQSKYTSKAMYSWLRGRLAAIFYQYYDLTASLCLMAQKSLQWEKGDTTSYLKTGTWNGAWAGLLSGEGLMLSLAQMEMAWMKYQKRELEVTRTVSLAAFLSEKLEGHTLPEAVSLLLKGDETVIGEGANKLEMSNNQLAVHFSMQDMELMADYASGSTGRIRSIAVTLPALLGPYQNIRGRLRTDATSLPAGCNECAISHAMQDNGLFGNDGSGDPRWGARWLPFEGLEVTNNNMTLSFADATGEQRELLDGLSDIILHVQFTVQG